MPFYDRQCETCGEQKIDCYEPMTAPTVACECGGNTTRVWLMGKANGIIPDGIPGGVYIKNGICWPDGTPRRFDSHTDIRKEAARQGLVNKVQHVGGKGTDKSKHTSKWF